MLPENIDTVEIETDRLLTKALGIEDQRTLIRDMKHFEKQWNVSYRAEPIEGVFEKIAEAQLKAAESDPENYMWYTFWIIIRKTDRIAVGSVVFKGTPDENGEVEIGYGMDKQFENNGYMAEAVNALCRWVLKQKKVELITAETDTDNAASHKILKKCGFERLSKNGNNTFWWEKRKI